MPRRKDQVPKAAIGPNNPLELNQILADLGPVFHDDVARLFFLALNRPDDEQEMAALLEYVTWVVERRDTAAFTRMAEAFKLVVERLKPGASPYNLTLHHAIQYELDAERRGERATAKGLADYLISKGVPVEKDGSYARRIHRRLGQARPPGRPRKK
jgi:hypothetical protein